MPRFYEVVEGQGFRSMDTALRGTITCPPGTCLRCWMPYDGELRYDLATDSYQPLESITPENTDMGRWTHIEGRPLGRTVTSTRARCYSCGAAGSRIRPLIYVHTADMNELCCPDCLPRYAHQCRDLANQWSLDAIEPADQPGIWYTRAYAGTRFFTNRSRFFTSRDAVLARQRTNAAPTYGYHETTPIKVHGWPTEPAEHELCFGVELEMEHKRDSATGQHDLATALGGCNGGLPDVAGRYVLARDGSLNQTGVEIITNPYTLDYHRTTFGWDKILGAVASIGKSGKGTDRCGMHVHMNRAAISALTLGKMLVFVNHPDNTGLIERIAQRRSDYARRVVKRITEGKATSGQKYESLHITEKTIECRLFRGNLRPERVLKNLEFCHSLVTYCSVAGIKECQGFAGYIAWLAANRGSYKHLVKFLAPHYDYKLTREDKTEDM